MTQQTLTESTVTAAPAESQAFRAFYRNDKRFRTAPSTHLIDRFMTQFINVGGVSIIAAVMGIFVFIFFQILPLFRGAEVRETRIVELGPGDYVKLGVDEWGEKPFVLRSDGRPFFLNGDGLVAGEFDLPEGESVSAFRYRPVDQTVVYGTESGKVLTVKVAFEPEFAPGGKRTITHKLITGEAYDSGLAEPVTDLDWAGTESDMAAAVVLGGAGAHHVRLLTFEREVTLFGSGELSLSGVEDLTARVQGDPRKVLVASTGEEVLVATDEDHVHFFQRTAGEVHLRQTFEPFGDLSDTSVASMHFILGDVSVVFTNDSGVNRIYSLSEVTPGQPRQYVRSKEFPALKGGADIYARSLRNKSFLIGHGDQVSLRHATTETVRWQKDLGVPLKDAVIGGKYNLMLFLDRDNKLHYYDLKDPHPEASFKAFFSKLVYEGSPVPRYEWQSTGGTDDFEPKLSLVPLIIGTLKGTVYAMIFALPIALLAAVYTSQFLKPGYRAVVKPTMEIMASLPSVVLGFFAALWLAPLIEDKVPSMLLTVVTLPVAALGFGWAWSQLPYRQRRLIPPGTEFIVFTPIFIATAVLCWHGGALLEQLAFRVKDPSTGTMIADFRLWWPHVTGTPFEQRNSLVVGFVMGFAVIPLIFTIAEDSLSNVPAFLRSGSLALGASRWQTSLLVVLPTASAGIFSALMIGLGRAIGETMIVVMATGNTPVMDLNIFSGMRTLSANIAVELPEAPHHGTLYRTLFLGALALFMATFLINTLAELLRQRLREKYKTV
ncbi:MAG: hypothetical protein MOGMAGMI_00066 [Candidatus Omnitrophica bacterium]|nr:hypothetical protein [Candidatus Omnitrophota bacterium]